ncbi:unnamed protein product [Rhizoctonia solani]|uniref:Protein kinase domain-containing protein n=1 Tax=Rhizoctonia solani TaxID=456999 RepID=A0A8H3CT15_9AGAM|nr:unnamed protein product [Rhizoctonia solani]
MPASLSRDLRLPLAPGLEDDDAVYGLNNTEQEWVAHEPYLKAKGYTLRPRYRPNWIPSWKLNGKYPADCEDSWELPAVKTLDAVRCRDNKHVSLKKSIPSDDEEAQNELEILQYLSQDGIRDDPRNHALQLLDSFPIPGSTNGLFLVTPFLSDWDAVPFCRFSELMDFIQQILEGLQFLHSNHIAHRDAQIANIMMDASLLYSEPFHPCDPHSSLDGARRLKIKRRSEASVRYYFIDFGLSSRFPSLADRRLVTGVKGREQRAPELLPTIPPPYDPFKLDIFTIGMVFKENIFQKYYGFHGLRPWIDRMTAVDPNARPSADEALRLYTQWAENQGGLAQQSDVWSFAPPPSLRAIVVSRAPP